MGEICGENTRGKYVEKIFRENMWELCRENMWGKIFHRFAGPNIKDDKYTSVLYSVQFTLYTGGRFLRDIENRTLES